MPDCGQAEHVHTADCYERPLICGMEEREPAAETRLVFTARFRAHQHSGECYNAAGELACGIVEGEYIHIHNEYCVDVEGKLACGLERRDRHTHTEACYTENRVLICELEEDPGHAHTEECFVIHHDLICGQAENSGHAHTDECYLEHAELTCGRAEEAGHAHIDACYDVTAAKTLICGKEESEPILDEEGNIIREGHIHSGDCYAVEEIRTLICGEAEREGHAHTDACYTVTRELICGETERAGHVHTEECYADWSEMICEQEEREGHIHTDACYETERTLICGRTEAGHYHSAACYDGDGVHVHCGEWEVPVFQSTEEDWIEETIAAEGHQHTEECRGEPLLICGQAEHTHTEECYENSGESEPEDDSDDKEGKPETRPEKEAVIEITPLAEDNSNTEITPPVEDNTDIEIIIETDPAPAAPAEDGTDTDTVPEADPVPSPSPDDSTDIELFIEIIDENMDTVQQDETESIPVITDYSDTPIEPMDEENPEDEALEPYEDPDFEFTEVIEEFEMLEEMELIEIMGMESAEEIEMPEPLEAEEETLSDDTVSEETVSDSAEEYTLTFQVEDYTWTQNNNGKYALVNGVYTRIVKKTGYTNMRYLTYGYGDTVPAGVTVYYKTSDKVYGSVQSDSVNGDTDYYEFEDAQSFLVWVPYKGGGENRYNKSSSKSLQTILTITAQPGQDISSYFPITGSNGISYSGYEWQPQGSDTLTDGNIISLRTMPTENITFLGVKPTTTTTTIHKYYYVETSGGASGTITWQGRNFELRQHIALSTGGNAVSRKESDFYELEGFERFGSDPEYGEDSTVILNSGNNYTISFYYTRKSQSLPPVAPTGFESDIAPYLWMVLGSILLFFLSKRARKGGGAG